MRKAIDATYLQRNFESMLFKIVINVLFNMSNEVMRGISKLGKEGNCRFLLERVKHCQISCLKVLMKKSAVSSVAII